MEIQWPLVLFSLLAGTGGALAAFVGLAGLLGGTRKVRETAALCSIVLVVLGGCFSVLHLASPLHAISAVTNLLSFSGVSIELMLIGINFVVMAAWLILARREGSEAGLKWVGVVGIVAGLALGFFCGHGYVIEGQPTWNTNVLPFAYLGSSLACGAFLYGVLAVKFGDDDELGGKLGVFTFACAVIGAVSAVAYAAVLGGSAFSQPLVMWGGVVVFGVVGAIASGVLAMRLKQERLLAVNVCGLVCAAIGGLSIRILMWLCATGFIDLFAHTVPSVMLNL